MSVGADFWAVAIASVVLPDVMARARRIVQEADARRIRSDYDTGSITEDEAYLLIVLAESRQARTVIEVGTFIGTSTYALATASTVRTIYTCDISNDCVIGNGIIRTHPHQSSTVMFSALVTQRVKADLCFFDGVLNADDASMLRTLTHPETVYAFHDYNYGPKIRHRKGATWLEQMPRKGIGNVNLLKPMLTGHSLIEPPEGTTLALMVPESRL